MILKSIDFSVLMAVHHKEDPEYLREAINSITINQTLQPNEVVLIQDGPLTEELYSVIDEFEKKLDYFRTYALKENVGLGEALRYGVEKCSYKWIARMDSDDISVPERFEKQISYLEKNPDIDVLGSNITEFGNTIDDVVSVKSMPTTHKDIKLMLKRRTPVCHVTVFINKIKLLEAGNYLNLPYVEDYYLWARMFANNATFASIDESLVFVRVGNGMLARRGNKQQIKSWKVLNEYMLQNGLVSYIDTMINKILIRVFLYMPISVKALLYKKMLRG